MHVNTQFYLWRIWNLPPLAFLQQTFYNTEEHFGNNHKMQINIHRAEIYVCLFPVDRHVFVWIVTYVHLSPGDLGKQKGRVCHAHLSRVFYFRNWKMTWKAISLATLSISWWPLWLRRQCSMRSSWRNPWRYEPYTRHFCLGFDCVIKNSDSLPAQSWDGGVNVIDLDVTLILGSPIGRTTMKSEAVAESWAHMILGWKIIVIFFFLMLSLFLNLIFIVFFSITI